MLRMMQPSTKCRNGLGEFAQVQAGDKLADPKLTAVYAENQNENSLVSFQGGHPSEAEHLWFCFFPLVVCCKPLPYSRKNCQASDG